MYYIEITGFEQGYNYINKESNLFYDYMNNDKMIIYKGNELLNKIGISKQKTGFGYKRFFICPVCKERHTRLYDTNKGFVCRNCLNVNIYSGRKNMYDEDLQKIIRLKIATLLKKIKATEQYVPINVHECIPIEKPKYMRYETYSITVMRIYFLDWIYWQIEMGEKYTIREINQMLEEENARFVYEHMLFPQYFRSAYEYIKLTGIDD
ncbi:hypothetical protein ACUH7Y_25465 [Clostridium beijerinckii]|uniref:Uncharacterized protein n=1 Tax=Clostridium beijerinckii TaxID=1520 RepID=A0A7X9SR59_CLOBE|nr:hypothetical protein [Clostridium beijerinckii]NMF06581.1 hypothetical protein [Clostridium beijerinckii]